MKATIYHNPRCGTSRAALKLLTDRGLEPVIIEYLKTPPGAAELKRLLKLMGLAPAIAGPSTVGVGDCGCKSIDSVPVSRPVSRVPRLTNSRKLVLGAE